MRRSFLLMSLLQGYYWFDDALNENMKQFGEVDFSRTQSLVFIHLALGVHRASVIARNLGVTRQAMSQLLREMRDRDLVVSFPDPDDKRAMLVKFSDSADSIRRDAIAILEHVEKTLATRIGAARVEALRTTLELDWGDIPRLPVPTDRPR